MSPRLLSMHDADLYSTAVLTELVEDILLWIQSEFPMQIDQIDKFSIEDEFGRSEYLISKWTTSE